MAMPATTITTPQTMANPLAATFQPIPDTSSPSATDGTTCQMSNTYNATCIENTSESHVACYAVIGVVVFVSVVIFLIWAARRYNKIKRPAFLGGCNTRNDRNSNTEELVNSDQLTMSNSPQKSLCALPQPTFASAHNWPSDAPILPDSRTEIGSAAAAPHEEQEMGTQLELYIYKRNEEVLKAIADLDTGAQGGNFISKDLLLRLGYGVDELGPSNDAWDCFNNETVYSLGTISLRWYAKGSREIQTTDFHVIGTGPFEMVLGAEFCYKKELLVRNPMALLLVKNKNKPSRAEQESINARRQENDDRTAHELAAKGWKWFREKTTDGIKHYRVEDGVKIYHEPRPLAQQGRS